MSKIKRFFLVAGLMSAEIVFAQSVDSLSSPLPGPTSGAGIGAAGAPAYGASSEMELTGIYASTSFAQAEIQVNGRGEYYGKGDIIPGGWEVISINKKQVELKKCNLSGKECETKKFIFNGGGPQ